MADFSQLGFFFIYITKLIHPSKLKNKKNIRIKGVNYG